MSSLQHGRLNSDGYSGSVTGNFRGVVDEVLGNVGVVALSDIVLDVDEVSEVVENGELLAAVGVWPGRRGAAQGVEFGAGVVLIPSETEWGGNSEEGEGEEGGEESRGMHCWSKCCDTRTLLEAWIAGYDTQAV